MTDPKARIEEIKTDGQQKIALLQELGQLEQVRIQYLGRKSELTAILRSLKSLPDAERQQIGQHANEVKALLKVLLDEKEEDLKKAGVFQAPTIDCTLLGRFQRQGKLHLVTQITDELVDIFGGMGFEVAHGPEVELEYYNFEALNFPKEHPARDMQDTFYISDELLLRTHTSPVQVRMMEKRRPPIKILAPGRVYRHESINVRRHVLFHQVEGFVVAKDITMADLKGALHILAWELFGRECKVRFRASFFPFTEPSAEFDISCTICNGQGCQVCKFEGWLEIGGCGMIDPAVFKYVGYDPEIYSGYAFGMGVERIAMLKYRIDDVRLFLENDLRFLQQF